MFDRIMVVDWSANGTPKLGADSIWVCCLEKSTGVAEIVNHPTRHAARAALAELATRPGRALMGFDFPLGYPAGFAAAAGMEGVPWEATWAHLAANVHDDERNRNDRWRVAAEWNQSLGTPHFWGAPPSQAGPNLPSRKPANGSLRLPQYRVVESRLRSSTELKFSGRVGLRPFTVWQLLGAGSVGSQVLTGIPVVHHLRRHPSLRDRVLVWPFDTGLGERPGDDLDDAIVVAEIWPSAVAFQHIDHPVKDARQVIALARHLAALDAEDTLAKWFAPTLSPAEREDVVAEEGWVLGVA